MSDKTAIEWSDATWNPLRGTLGRHFCVKLSPGCDHCYASTMTKRFGGVEYPKARDVVVLNGQIVAKAEDGPKTDRVRLDDTALLLPLAWKEPRRIFVCSMTDLFGEWVPDEWIDRIFGVMKLTPQHTYQVLTKRPTRMKQWFEERWQPDAWATQAGVAEGDRRIDRVYEAAFRLTGDLPESDAWWDANGDVVGGFTWPLPNVWLGVSVESDAYTWRARVLTEIPAAVRFVSAEPLLGPLPTLQLKTDGSICPDQQCGDSTWDHECELAATRRAIDWLIVGGESGGGLPLERRLISSSAQSLDWVRDLRDRAQAAGVAFFFKQWGGATPKAGGRVLDGREWSEFPVLAGLS